MSDEVEAELPALVVPGPEVRDRINKFAAKLSERPKTEADALLAKILTSAKRDEYLYVDSSHIFYPYFLNQLSEYRNHPELRPQKGAGKKAAAAATAGASGSSSTTAAAAGGGASGANAAEATAEAEEEAAERERRRELLRRVEEEARRYLADPHPNVYSLRLPKGTASLPAFDMDVMSCAAQYVAKYGETFLATMQNTMRRNQHFRFLSPDDVRHVTFRGLVESYKRVLAFREEEVESRLEALQSPRHVLEDICATKARYTTAEMARRKAALLTDEDLRRQLCWDHFAVIKTVTLADAGLDGVPPARGTDGTTRASTSAFAAAAPPPRTNEADGSDVSTAATPASLLPPPSLRPQYQPVLMTSSLVSTSAAPGSKAGKASFPGGATAVSYIKPPSYIQPPSAPAGTSATAPAGEEEAVLVEAPAAPTAAGTVGDEPARVAPAAGPRLPAQKPLAAPGSSSSSTAAQVGQKRPRSDDDDDDDGKKNIGAADGGDGETGNSEEAEA